MHEIEVNEAELRDKITAHQPTGNDNDIKVMRLVSRQVS